MLAAERAKVRQCVRATCPPAPDMIDHAGGLRTVGHSAEPPVEPEPRRPQSQPGDRRIIGIMGHATLPVARSPPEGSSYHRRPLSRRGRRRTERGQLAKAKIADA